MLIPPKQIPRSYPITTYTLIPLYKHYLGENKILLLSTKGWLCEEYFIDDQSRTI